MALLFCIIRHLHQLEYTYPLVIFVQDNKANLSGANFTGAISVSNDTVRANTWNNLSNFSGGQSGSFDLNDLLQPGFYGVAGNSTNKPTTNDAGNLLILPYRLTGNIYPFQIFCSHNGRIYHRLYIGTSQTWNGWMMVTSTMV